MNPPVNRRQFFAGGAAVACLALMPTPSLAESAEETAPGFPMEFDGKSFHDLAAAKDNFTVRPMTLSIQFKTSPGSGGTLLSAGDSGSPDIWKLGIDSGHVVISESSSGKKTEGRFPVPSDRRGELDDGNLHWVTLRCEESGTSLYVDGQWAHAFTRDYSLFAWGNPNVLTAGAVRNRSSASEFFTGSIRAISCTPTALTDEIIAARCTLPDTKSKWTPFLAYSASAPLVNRFTEVPGLQSWDKGTVFAEFSTTSSGTMAIMSLGDTRAESTDFCLALKDGQLVVEHRSKGTNNMKFTVASQLNDGKRHSVCAAVSERGTRIYIDGSEVERHSHHSFASSLDDLNGLWIGGNTDIHGEEWKFTGRIGRVKIFPWALTSQQIAGLAEQPVISAQALFDKGYAGSSNYRIPALTMTSAGTLIAVADQRTSNPMDSPNHIQTTCRRSTDGGRTWSALQTILPQPGAGRAGASAIDSTIVQDSRSGKLVAVIDRFPGGFGQGNCAPGTGYDENGLKILFDQAGEEFRLHDDGSVTRKDGSATSYRVAGDGSVTRDGADKGNIHLPKEATALGGLFEHETSYLVMVTSSDDGQSWGNPKDITHQVKEPWMRFLGTGPGSAIQLTAEKNRGRIVVPVYYNNAKSMAGIYSSAVIYTDDAGATWHRGKSPNDGRVVNGTTISSETLNTMSLATHEPSVAERADGTLVMYMRNRAPGGKVLSSRSSDGGETWDVPTPVDNVPDIFSQPNLINGKDPSSGESRMFFSNASKTFPGEDGRNTRGRGVIRMSVDDSATWGRNRVFRANNYVYSSMIQFPDGDLGLLWELEWDGIYFSRIPYRWIADYPVVR
ncbi:exo-alpha-sialidase [Rothia uropygialis]|uniref:exo-alpha-sialidase n=1 Tax=Kocuria sp. 36 TaxID=1415402 RepID=UPI0013EA2CEC|nr:exo-alpha-sialidase [Kocuria sp. 36]